MATVLESNKARIAKRVIEVFEFFDQSRQTATVMDIVREYGRPQSSTSELLSCLVEMGLLYKDPRSRTYTPTPRLATLGSSAQPEIIGSGRLFAFMDRLAQSSRHSVALFGRVGTHVQIFRWSAGAYPLGGAIASGLSDPLSGGAAGQLLLSTLASEGSSKLLRRLNAELPESERFNHAEMVETVRQFQRRGHATGDAGFGIDAKVTAALIPQADGERPLAVGVVYPSESMVDAGALATTLRCGIEDCRHERPLDAPALAPALMRAV